MARCNAEPLRLIVPFYNEGRNFPALWAAITAHIRLPFQVFVVYDFDVDDMIPVVQRVHQLSQILK